MSTRNFSRRFYVPPHPDSGVISDGTLEIDGPSAHHMINVLRVAPNDQVVLFDGVGCEYEAVVQSVKKSKLVVEVGQASRVSRELPFELSLAVALPKGDRQKVLVEKLVEVGVARLIPINAKRSVVKAVPKSTDKLLRRVIEASKQCGRNTLMQIDPPMTTRDLFETDGEQLKVIAHPYDADNGKTKSPAEILGQVDSAQAVLIAIGPEGGFDRAEVEMAVERDWQPVKIGPAILRVETAAVALATLFGVGRCE